jgi:hypothetical protein
VHNNWLSGELAYSANALPAGGITGTPYLIMRAVFYLEANAENGLIWKPYKHKLSGNKG